MSAVTQIPRNCILWLLVAQSVVILPHFPRLNWWMISIWLLCAVWRLAMYRGEAAHPSLILRIVVVVLGSLGIVVSFGEQGVLDIAVAALIFAFSLKLIEVKQRRDLYLVFYLAFFVIAASFLYSQSLLLFAYQSVAALIILSGMVATQQSSETSTLGSGHAFRIALVTLAQGLPMLLLLFLFFPRIAPIWSVASSSGYANTGMSESMSPGDISKLSKSTELVFTVDTLGNTLTNEQMYWRGMTYEDFDGRTWSRGPSSQAILETNGSLRAALRQLPIHKLAAPFEHDITYANLGSRWLFAMPLAEFEFLGASEKQFSLLQDFNYELSKPSQSVTRWRVRSYLDYVIEPYMRPQRQKMLTALPDGNNPEALNFAQRIWRETGNANAFVSRLGSYFANELFYYSLEPPPLGRHSVDEFLFSTKTGFCEHYASAATVILRAAGIPARVVIGYQGGEINPINQTLAVRQLDAHAWVEYWVENQGWIRFDPTAWVAPERVSQGLLESLEQQEGANRIGLFSSLGLINNEFYRSIRHRLDAINYAWHKAFVGFDQDSQRKIVERWFGDLSAKFLLLLAIAATITCFALLALFVLVIRRQRELSYEDKLYRLFCARLARAGLPRAVGEAPSSYARRIAVARPDLADQVNLITRLYEQMVFQDLPQAVIKREMARAVRNFKLSYRVSDIENILPFPNKKPVNSSE